MFAPFLGSFPVWKGWLWGLLSLFPSRPLILCPRSVALPKLCHRLFFLLDSEVPFSASRWRCFWSLFGRLEGLALGPPFAVSQAGLPCRFVSPFWGRASGAGLGAFPGGPDLWPRSRVSFSLLFVNGML